MSCPLKLTELLRLCWNVEDVNSEEPIYLFVRSFCCYIKIRRRAASYRITSEARTNRFIDDLAFGSDRDPLWMRNEVICDRERQGRKRQIRRVIRSKLNDMTCDRSVRSAIKRRTNHWYGCCCCCLLLVLRAGCVHTSFVSLRLRCQHEYNGWTVNGDALDRIRLWSGTRVAAGSGNTWYASSKSGRRGEEAE